MKCWFNWEIEAEEQEKIEALLEKVLAKGLEMEKITVPVEISITITTAEEVHRLNLEYRGIDRTTDVLSFPLGEDNKYDVDPETGSQSGIRTRSAPCWAISSSTMDRPLSRQKNMGTVWNVSLRSLPYTACCISWDMIISGRKKSRSCARIRNKYWKRSRSLDKEGYVS